MVNLMMWVEKQTGRLFYVNLVTKKAFERLPAAVSASMLGLLGKEHPHHQQQPHSKRHALDSKRKVTVPQSPQFSQMSWQKKKSDE